MYILTVITENQKSKSKAEKLAEIIKAELDNDINLFKIEKYNKFENSFKIVFEVSKDLVGNPISYAILQTSKISNPWFVYYTDNQIELIFNKTESSQYLRIEFNVIKWAHWKNSI